MEYGTIACGRVREVNNCNEEKSAKLGSHGRHHGRLSPFGARLESHESSIRSENVHDDGDDDDKESSGSSFFAEKIARLVDLLRGCQQGASVRQ